MGQVQPGRIESADWSHPVSHRLGNHCVQYFIGTGQEEFELESTSLKTLPKGVSRYRGNGRKVWSLQMTFIEFQHLPPVRKRSVD